MESIFIKDIMVPLEDYATVSEEATLFEALAALNEAQERFDQGRYRHRAILVYDSRNQIVGKLSQLDVIRSLEPKYEGIGDLKEVSRYGINPDSIRGMIKQYGLWKQPLDYICRKAGSIRVKEVMYTPTRGEYVADDATLDEAVHQLIIGRHQSLLVTRNRAIVGILRLTDVFKKIADMVSDCREEPA